MRRRSVTAMTRRMLAIYSISWVVGEDALA
jgi:hypothetical protein